MISITGNIQQHISIHFFKVRIDFKMVPLYRQQSNAITLGFGIKGIGNSRVPFREPVFFHYGKEIQHFNRFCGGSFSNRFSGQS